MCLIIDRYKNKKTLFGCKPHILKGDIIVYKIGTLSNKSTSVPTFKSDVQGFTYIIGKLYTMNKLKVHKCGYKVYEGFHSFEYITARMVNSLTEELVIVCCTIPKGSKIYFGTNNDIVSDNIIINNYFSRDGKGISFEKVL